MPGDQQPPSWDRADPDGLHAKYAVRKIDSGEYVDDCFVLRPERDAHALVALVAYADSLPECPLKRDLRRWAKRIPDPGRQPTVHELKSQPPYFVDVLEGRKTFEVRRDDRPGGFRVGDTLHLREWQPTSEIAAHRGEYTGRECRVRVTYRLEDHAFPSGDGLLAGYVVLGIEREDRPARSPTQDATVRAAIGQANAWQAAAERCRASAKADRDTGMTESAVALERHAKALETCAGELLGVLGVGPF